jgi:hypothetical protein
MTSRIAKKHAAIFTARVLSVPMALDHARPSFWLIDRGAQRRALATVIVRRLGVSRAVARRATRNIFA